MPPAPPYEPPSPAAAADWLAALPVAIVAADAAGRVVWANDAAAALLGPLSPGAPLATALGLDAAAQGRLAAADGAEFDFEHRRAAFAATPRRSADGTLLLTLRRRETERRLQAEADQLRALLDIACEAGRLGRFERDLRTGRGRWDRAMYEMRGLPGRDGEAPLIDEVDATIVAADRDGYIASIRQTLATLGRQRFRYHVRTPCGSIRSLLCTCLTVAGADGHAERVFGFEHDETVLGSVGPDFDSALAQVAMGADLTGIIVWRHEIASDRFYYSPRATEVLGMPPAPDGVPAAELYTVLHPEDLPKVRAQHARALATGEPVDAELRYRRPDRDGWCTLLARRAVERDAEGRAVAFIGVSMDITERVEESRRAAELGRRFDFATRVAGIGYWIVPAGTAQPVWNAGMSAIHGLAPDVPPPPQDEWLRSFVHPEDRERVRRETDDWVSGRTRRLQTELRIVRPDGGVRELSVHGCLDVCGDGSRFGITLDVTDRRAAEQAQHERALALRESEAKSRFLSRMSHELRTPLNAVLGFTELLLADCGAGDAPRRDRLESVRAAGAQLLALVDDVLDVAALEGGELRVACVPLALAPLVDDAMRLVEPLRAAHEVTIRAAALDGRVLGDAVRLRQVLQNLLTNAIKYNRRGGQVELQARTDDAGVVVTVADTGRGMDGAQLRRLFEPFNRLGAERGSIPGTGIGLVIVKVLVERMGGSIELHSTPGVGTRVELRLPRAPAPAAVAAAAAVATAPPLPARRLPPARGAVARVVYIEDNPVNALIVRELAARRPDVDLVVAEDGGSGVARARDLQPDLILLDMQLPDFDGHEVLRRLRADPATADIPVVALSANAMPEDIERALAAGIVDYWTKPLDCRAFMASLDTMFEVDGA